MSEQIGYLVFSRQVVCLNCWNPGVSDGVPIYRENVGNYRQTCIVCKAMLVEGKTPSWPVLFDGRARRPA